MQEIYAIERWLQSNKDFILNSISEIIKIKTTNLPPKCNEKPGQEYIYNIVSSYIPAEDIDVFEIDDVAGNRNNPYFFPTIDGIGIDYKNRPNLVSRLKGTDGKKSLVFSGHIDTMPDYGKKWTVFEDPYSGKIKDGKLYGRGSSDIKAGTLSGFIALKCLQELKIKLKGDVFAESVVDEENGGVNGTIAARLRNPYIDFAILTEANDLAVGVETFGGTDWKISVKEKGMPYATDAFAFKKVSNTEVVVLGPSGANLHGIDEYLEIESIFNLIRIMLLTAIDYCS